MSPRSYCQIAQKLYQRHHSATAEETQQAAAAEAIAAEIAGNHRTTKHMNHITSLNQPAKAAPQPSHHKARESLFVSEEPVTATAKLMTAYTARNFD